MTARQIFEATFIELSKVQAPTLLLYEFNYLINKAINQYVNKVYSVYDLNQQTADDLRVLKATAYLTPEPLQVTNRTNETNLGRAHSSIASLYGATYVADLPQDYLHLLNCIGVYYVAKQKDCWDAGTYIEIPATRLTADSWGQIISDIYNRPSPMKPYYYIHYQNNSTTLPTNSETDADYNQYDGYFAQEQQEFINQINDLIANYNLYYDSEGNLFFANCGGEVNIKDHNGYEREHCRYIKFNPGWFDRKPKKDTTDTTDTTDSSTKDTTDSSTYVYAYSDEPSLNYYKLDEVPMVKADKSKGINLSRILKTTSNKASYSSAVERIGGVRYGNSQKTKIEFRYGKDSSVFELKELQVDYIKAPQFIRLTQEQIDLTEDTSQIMEFPDYVNQEIINELVHLVMEHSNDPRLSNNIQITNSIARPTRQQAQAQA